MQYPKLQADTWEWVPDVKYTDQESKLECRWQYKNSDRFFLNEDMECVQCAEDSFEPGTMFMLCTARQNGYCTLCSNASMPVQNAMWDPEHHVSGCASKDITWFRKLTDHGQSTLV